MGRIYDLALKLKDEGIYNERTAQIFAPPGHQKHGQVCLFHEQAMGEHQIEEQLKLMMFERRRILQKKKEEEEFDDL